MQIQAYYYMGGGNSKQQQQQQIKMQQAENTKKKVQKKSRSKQNSKESSPRNGQKDSKENIKTNKQTKKDLDNLKLNQKTKQKIKTQNHYNDQYLNGQDNIRQVDVQQYNQRNNQRNEEQNRQSKGFDSWPQLFQQDGRMDVKIMVVSLKPTYQIKNINRQFSQHSAQLSWSYQQKKLTGQNQLLLRFVLDQAGGYHLVFLVDQEFNCQEGEEYLWKMVCPFRTKDEVTKVGTYICERSYDNSSQPQENQEIKVDPELFLKWDEKIPTNRTTMKRLLHQRRMIEKMKSNQSFEYTQSTKYFTSQDEWVFSVLIQQKHNTFQSWLIQADNFSNAKQAQKSKAMSITLKNDIETRQNMYIEEMRKKRKMLNNKSKLITK